MASSNASLDSLAKAVGALSSDELPRGFGEALAERIELNRPKDRQKQLRVAVTGQKRLAELPPEQVSRIRTSDCRTRFQASGDSCRRRNGCPPCREYEGVFLFVVPQAGGRGIPESS